MSTRGGRVGGASPTWRGRGAVRLHADISVKGRELVISRLPPDVSTWNIYETLSDFKRAFRNRVFDVNDHSTSASRSSRTATRRATVAC